LRRTFGTAGSSCPNPKKSATTVAEWAAITTELERLGGDGAEVGHGRVPTVEPGPMRAPLSPFALAALLCSCSRAAAPPSGADRPLVAADEDARSIVIATPPALRPTPSQLGSLQRIWSDAAAAGHPIRVTIDARTTLGYGCDCAHFVFSDIADDEHGPDVFFYPRVAPGVQPIAEWKVFGTFRLTGHFTGRRVGWEKWHEETFHRRDAPSEDQDTDPHPEFFVESWCYDASGIDLESDFNRETVEKMRQARVPQCLLPMTSTPVPRER
jgi:hypothetical protein